MIVFPKLRSKEHLLNKTIHKSNKNLYTCFPTKFCFYTDFFFFFKSIRWLQPNFSQSLYANSTKCTNSNKYLHVRERLSSPKRFVEPLKIVWSYHLFLFIPKKNLQINNFCIALKVTFTIDRKLQGFGLNYILPKWKLHDKTLI